MVNFFFGNYTKTIITITCCLLLSGMIILNITNSRQPSLLPQQPSKIVWGAFDGGGDRSGVNNYETAITAATVPTLKKIWATNLPYRTNGSPVEVPNVTTPSGTKDLLFITTQKGSLIALDAATGTIIWQKDTTGQFIGVQGTSSSPAIDPSNQFIYSYGLDGKVHRYTASNGTESTTAGFPATVTLSTDVEKISAPLNVGNGYLYVTTSGYDGDFGQYVGHVVAVNLASGTATFFNSLCSNVKTLSPAGFCPQKGSGIWSRAGAVIDPNTKNVFVVTGNGNYDASSGGTNYGDSIVELTPDLSRVVDSYTPTSFSSLDSQDDDLGSTGITILPAQPGSTTPRLAVLGGKDNKIRVVNMQNLSGQGSPAHVGGELQEINISCQIFSHAIAWNDSSNQTWVFFTDMCANLLAYKVVTSAGHTSLQPVYQKSGLGKNSAFLANGILFVPGSSLSAIDPTTGTVLWSSSQATAGGDIGPLHWQSPIVVNGAVYMPDDNGTITAYASSANSQPSSHPTHPLPSPTSIFVSPTVFCIGQGICATQGPTQPMNSGSPSQTPSSAPGSPQPSGVSITPVLSLSPTPPGKKHTHRRRNVGLIRKVLQLFMQIIGLLLKLMRDLLR